MTFALYIYLTGDVLINSSQFLVVDKELYVNILLLALVQYGLDFRPELNDIW